jgi:glutamate-5-semialdehyde dehydrogenase
MLAAVLADSLTQWAVNQLYTYGTLTGWYVWAGDDPTIEASLMIVARLASFAAVTQFVLWFYRESWRTLGSARFRPWLLALAFVPIVISVPIFVSEVDNLFRFLHSTDGLDDWNFAPEIGELVGGSWPGAILAVIVAPLTEEVLFRGLILRGLLSRWPVWPSIVVSALLFALMHLNPAQAPATFALGLALGWMYARTRSLGLSILGHALNNLSVFLPLIPFAVDNYSRVPDPPTSTFHPWWFDLMGLALFSSGLWLVHRWAAPVKTWLIPLPPKLPLSADGTPPPLGAAANSLCTPPILSDATSQMSVELAQLVTSLAQRARAASLVLATAPRAKKDAALTRLAGLLESAEADLLAANARDLASPEAATLAPAARERLTLTTQKLQQLAASVREVVQLPDPVGEVLDERVRPNGLKIRKLRVPIGVIGIIYEARPNVTIDCAILCLKSGNASILRGGKECFHTNTALAELIRQAIIAEGLPADAVQLVPTTDRAALNTLLKLDTLIHCIIPRGGESLIRYVAQNSTIPVIKHYKGVCFVYVDAAADLTMAEAITVNAKVSRPSVCNAAEQLLVHRDVAALFLPAVARALAAKNVELRCDPESAAILQTVGIGTTPAAPADYTAEFLDYIIAVRVVDSLETAIATINRDSSNHSDAIITADEAAARRFLAEVDSATVYWNASTRFTDGFEFGYGAEIGISTDRLHARGPMGLPELCSYKFIIEGNGQVRS